MRLAVGDLARARARLHAAGVACEDGGGIRRSDPDGNRLGLWQS